MKMLLVLILGISLKAQAQGLDKPIITEKLIEETTPTVKVKLDATTVQCNLRSFINTELVVIIPAIIYYAQLNHNSTMREPNLSAGFCDAAPGNNWFSETDSRIPLLTAAPIEEEVKLRIRRTEVFKDYLTRCEHEYREEVSTEIRGIKFKHVQKLRLAPVDGVNCK